MCSTAIARAISNRAARYVTRHMFSERIIPESTTAKSGSVNLMSESFDMLPDFKSIFHNRYDTIEARERYPNTRIDFISQ